MPTPVSPMLAEAWRLDRSVALRPEPFGALAYHFGTRKRQLPQDARAASTSSRRLGDAAQRSRTRCAAPACPTPNWPAYVGALAGLAAGGMIQPRERSMTIAVRPTAAAGRLVDQFEYGLDAPICLTWELTYACNLACVHCLSARRAVATRASCRPTSARR